MTSSPSNPSGQPAKRLQTYLQSIHIAASQYCHPLQALPLTHKKSESAYFVKVVTVSTSFGDHEDCNGLESLEKALIFMEVRLGVTVIIEFLLIIVFEFERDGFAQLEMLSVQSQKLLAIEFEFEKHGRTGITSMSVLACFTVVLLVCDLSIFEEGDVEERGFF